MTLIDKNKLYTKLTEQEEIMVKNHIILSPVKSETLRAIAAFKLMIYNEPSVEAIPIKRGKWKSDGYGHVICTACNKDNVSGWKSKYCPNCGARMKMED